MKNEKNNMFEMSLYELEHRIKEYIKENELDNAKEQQFDNYQVGFKLANIVKEFLQLSDAEDIKLSVYSSCGIKNAISISGKQSNIIIEYKRTRYIVNSIWRNYAYYGIKSVEIYYKDTYKNLNDFIEQDKKCYEYYKKKNEEDYEDMFEKIGVNYYKGGFSLKELINFKNAYDRLSYAKKEELQKEYGDR